MKPERAPPIFRRNRGVTLVEITIVLAILSVLTTVALPMYQESIRKTEIVQAKKDIVKLSLDIQKYYAQWSDYPPDLESLAGPAAIDPWGNAYEYLSMSVSAGKGKGKGGNGKLRKDRNLVPINTDYDLYSKGPDGRSVSPLTAKHSRDDIIRANNGEFIGTAAEY